MTRETADLVWEPASGVEGDDVGTACDLSGHFYALVELLADGRWSFSILDYQTNELLAGVAHSRDAAQAVVAGWDRWVVSSGTDPSRDWPDDE